LGEDTGEVEERLGHEQLPDSAVLPKTRREFLGQAGAAGFALPVLTTERERHTGPFESSHGTCFQ
jgi:hypothetical protein